MNLNEKIRMAEALTELGVDVLEAGFAIASPGDFESVKAIAESIGQRADTPVLASLARAGAQDVMAAANAKRAHQYNPSEDNLCWEDSGFSNYDREPL